MQIAPISSIVSSIDKASAVGKTTPKESFTNVLNDAMTDAKETDAQVKQGNMNLLTGENDSIHTAMIESEKAELALNLAIQVRNKVVDAYNEVMRMQL